MNVLFKRRARYYVLVVTLLTSLTTQMVVAATQPSQQGQEVFASLCSSCHGKDLTGGVGFNLIDAEWIHGNKPEQIVKNIQRGFAQAGMPAFKGILTDSQINDVVSFILSKQLGFRDLSYTIYQLPEKAKKSFDAIDTLPIASQGKYKNGLINFDLPEIKSFIIETTGDFYAPTDQDTHFKIQFLPPHMLVELWIDGEKIKYTKPVWGERAWPLKRGKQAITIRYNSVGRPNWQGNGLHFFVTDQAQTVKLFATSVQAKAYLADSKHEVLVKDKARIQRKKAVNLPSHSILVGLPQKVNYAFNSRSCAIVGVWQGEFLDVGPNIQGRGKDGSLAMGNWVFHQPNSIKAVNDTKTCRFIKYTTTDDPTFYYQQQGYEFAVTGTTQSNNQLSLNYQATKLPAQARHSHIVEFALPQVDKLTIQSPQAAICNGKLTFDLSKHPSFSLQLKLAKMQ
ncbi:c-type cytochrome [Catenovulum maritimum]|uniref:c-type cytochrome n=1 Tax=Catenovulum maritimum TaxID=1513271 RepID=UPI0006616D49|nr:cytochrome c [Catenovulum maritimum]